VVIGSSKRVQGTGRNRSVKKANLPRRPSEIEQLWQEIIQPWLWPSLTLGLLFLAIYRHGAETPLNSMLFTALASLMLVLAMVDRNNLVALARLRDWKWAGIGLLAVWIVMIIQLLPIPFFSGNTELWGRKDSVTVDPDLTIRAIVSMGSAVAFFVFGAIFGADRQRREIVLLLLAVMLPFIFFQAFDAHLTRSALFGSPDQRFSLRMEGTFLNANTFAIMMVLFFACSAGVFLAESRAYKGKERVWVRIVAALMVVGTAYCIYLTMSRAAWLLSFLILFGLAWLLKPGYRIQTSLFGISALLVLMIIWNSAEQLGLPIKPLNLSQGLDGRFADWQPGLDLTSMRPVLGWGAGTFSRAMEPVREIPMAASSLIVITPQNSILLIMSESGVLGLAAWTILSVGICLFVANGLRARSASPTLAAALILGAIAVIAQSLFDFPMSIPAIAALWAFMLGYCGGLGGKAPQKSSLRPARNRETRRRDTTHQRISA